ncbi:transcription repressor OFP8-like [Zingiber officinale]|uniref:transcription repressor OFP8-like n=1 Tax=Zingiber officinale TaxID=94328 RepID=UPI001C4DB547|nr:transcription repressor OFP8-like [Zingiber officinale]
MSFVRRRFVLRHPVVVDVGCSCRRPKLLSFFYSSTKPKSSKSPSLLSPYATTSLSETLTSTTTATTTTMTTTATAISSSPSRYGDFVSSPSPPFRPPARGKSKKKGKRVAARKGVVEGSTAVVKDSSDPYLDFRDSMLQMIVEMEIYAWDDLRDLLHRFLALNAACHHHLIFRAFAEIWNGVFAAASPPPPPASAFATRPRRR